MRKGGKIVISIFSVIFVTAFGLLVAFNWQSIKALFNGQIIYTQEQVDEIKNNTWEEAIKQEDIYLQQIESYKKAVEDNEILINSLNDQILSLTQQNQSLTISKEELEANVKSLSAQVEDLNKTVNENKTTIDSLNSQIEELENSNNSNLEQIASLKNQVKTLEESNVKYEATVNSLNKTIELLNLQIEGFEQEEIELNTQISNLQQTIQEYQNEIENYKQIIEDLKAINSCVVTFKVNNTVVSTQQVGKTESPEFVEDPIGNFVFEGWIIEGTENIVDPFTYSIVENTVFVAKVRTIYNITFTADDEIVNTQSLENGAGLILPTSPEKEHYTFIGWSLDGVNVIDPLTYQIIGDTNFIAVFEIANQLPFTFENGVLTSYTGNDTEITIPESYSIVDGYFVEGNDVIVEEIKEKAFYKNNFITKVNFSNNLKIINNNAFESCSNLIQVNFTDNLTTIGSYVFKNCTNLIEFTIGEKVTSLGTEIFNSCVNLKNVYYNAISCNEKIISSGGRANFINTYSSTNEGIVIYIGSKVEFIPTGIFGSGSVNGKSNIVKVVFEENSSCLEIRVSAFRCLGYLKEIVLPEGLKNIEDSAFLECKSLINLVIPDSVETIGAAAFEGCSSIETLSLGTGIKTIRNRAFNNLTSLQYLYYNIENLKTGNYGWLYFDAIGWKSDYTTVIIGANVTYIPKYIFDFYPLSSNTGYGKIDELIFEEGSLIESVPADLFYFYRTPIVKSISITNEYLYSLFEMNYLYDVITNVSEVKILTSVDKGTSEYLNTNFSKVTEGNYNIYTKIEV